MDGTDVAVKLGTPTLKITDYVGTPKETTRSVPCTRSK